MEDKINFILTIILNFIYLNSFILKIGRNLAWIAILLMVLVILIQVFFRYALNNALPWPDEAARFLMLWMTGFIAPSAYRWGGFVSIDMLKDLLPRKIGIFINLLLLSISLFILIVGFKLGLKHIQIGWIFGSSSLKIPFHLIGGKSEAVKLAWMYMSIPVGIFILILINIELFIRTIFPLFNSKYLLPVDPSKKDLEN